VNIKKEKLPILIPSSTLLPDEGVVKVKTVSFPFGRRLG
jgi:hypothetical protein